MATLYCMATSHFGHVSNMIKSTGRLAIAAPETFAVIVIPKLLPILREVLLEKAALAAA